MLGPVSGTLSSLGYPGTYPNNTVCEWEISVPRGSRIHFRFAELDIENRDCQVNYLRLYDGIGPKRSVIGERYAAMTKATKIGSNYCYYLCGHENDSKAVSVDHRSAQTGFFLYLFFPVREAKQSCYQLSSIAFKQDDFGVH